MWRRGGVPHPMPPTKSQTGRGSANVSTLFQQRLVDHTVGPLWVVGPGALAPSVKVHYQASFKNLRIKLQWGGGVWVGGSSAGRVGL